MRRHDATTTADAPAQPRPIVGYRFQGHGTLVDAMDPEESGSWFPVHQAAVLVEVMVGCLRNGGIATISTYRLDEWKDDEGDIHHGRSVRGR